MVSTHKFVFLAYWQNFFAYTLVGLDVSLDTFANEFICTKLPESSLEH